MSAIRRGRRARERGSIPLALLATIVVAGLVAVVVATTIAGQRAVRFDQGFTGAVQVAEIGVQQVLHLINTGQLSPADAPAQGSGTTGEGHSYEWGADTDFESGDKGPVEWTVTVTGQGSGDVARTVEVTISDDPLFDLGAFSDVQLVFGGGNTADSYNSDTGEWCTRNGRVGSNGDLDFSGSAGGGPCEDEDYRRSDQTVDVIDLFDWEANPDPARCDHSGGSNCYENNDPANTWYLETHDDPIQTADDVDWMKDALGVSPSDDGQPRGYSCERANSKGDWTVPDGIAPADSTNGVAVDFLTEQSAGSGEVYAYCADTVTFEDTTQLADGASAENPVAFVVGERVDFDKKIAVNIACDASGVDCGSNQFDPRSVAPEAAALQIYSPAPSSAGSHGDVIHALNHSQIAASVYAPRGPCGGTGNAQIDMFGSLQCSNIRNQGGWQFHYDDRLGGAVRTGKFEIDRWTEQ